MTVWTEEEAKTKWCPFAPTQFEEVTTDCIASRCMAWRWKARFGTDPVNPENCAQLEPTHGYCGLAGRPE